jgi:class 3 adenylate cyclase
MIVLVRLDVDPRSGVGFATGDTMNTTARLEAAAPAMGVTVGERTHAATETTIAYEELEPVSAKGKAEPLAAWRALAPISRVADERDATPFRGSGAGAHDCSSSSVRVSASVPAAPSRG